MSFVNYPGHLVAVGWIVLWAAILVVAYRSVRGDAARWRWVLAALPYAAIVSLLIIVWNPSRVEKEPQKVRNTVLAFFDTSQSMSTKDCDGQARLDRAMEIFRTTFGAGGPDGPEYRIYGFDAKAYASGTLSGLQRWGNETQFDEVMNCVDRLARRSTEDEAAVDATSPVVGAIVFTDGQASRKDVTGYKSLVPEGVTTVWVGVGSTTTSGDVMITRVAAPTKVAIRSVFDVGVSIAAKEARASQVVVALEQDGHVLDEKRVALSTVAGGEPVMFVVGADVLGSHRLTATVKSDATEANVENNRLEAMVDVVEPTPLKVLLYTQVANQDIGKVRQALERDKRVELALGMDAIVAKPNTQVAIAGQAKLPQTREEFFAYDVIVLGPCLLDQMDAKQIDALYAFIVDRGGSVIFLPGREIYEQSRWQNEKLRTLLPVEFVKSDAGVMMTTGRVTLTSAGVASGVLTAADLSAMPVDATAFYSSTKPKPAAQTLLTCGEEPLLCTHRVGEGFVAWINTYGLFEWYREHLNGGLLQRLTSGLISAIAKTNRVESGVRIFARRSSESPQTVIFDATVNDREWMAVSNATVLLTVDDQTLRMTEVQAGRYRAEVANVSKGHVLAKVEAQANGEFLGEKRQVFSVPRTTSEMDAVTLDEAFLKSLAENVGGTYVNAANVDNNAAEEFAATSDVGRFRCMVSMWRQWWVFVAICSVLSVQWFLRRRLGLL